MAANTPTDDRYGPRMVVNTMFDVNQIEQMVDFLDTTEVVHAMSERVQKHVLRLREEGVRKALLELGWIPPEVSKDLKQLLRSVQKVAGNQSDAALDTRTGPNDAALRGCFVIAARTYAAHALRLLGEEPENFNSEEYENG